MSGQGAFRTCFGDKRFTGDHVDMSSSNRREFLIRSAPLLASSLLLRPISEPATAYAAETAQAQAEWRFCSKCNSMFFNGAPKKGRCPAGEGHAAQGFNFSLPYGNLPEAPKAQANWRFCDKCFSLFFNGASDKGRCPAGGGHNAQGFLFRLPHDVNADANNQGAWRYCSKCHAMFYDGYGNKGKCAAGGAHTAQGFQFVLGHGPASDFAGEVHFHQVITTPSGTALGGNVDLTLRSDGTYKAHFHMHDSGLPDYNFLVRAVFVASNGLVLALQHSGHVEGTESTKLTRGPHRNDDKDVEGFSPFIKDFWPAVREGRFAVSKEYSATGVVGFVQDVAKAVLNVATSAARGAVGAVIALGDEMKQAFNSLKLGGDFGVLGGVVVFAFGGSLVLAVTSGAAVGAVTNALVKQRPMTAAEAGFAAKVFGGSLPPASRVILTNLLGVGGRAFTMPGVGGNIYLNIGANAFARPLTHVEKSYPKPGQLLIHELTHAWQIHHKKFVPGWVCSGLIGQAQNTFGDSAYKYGPPGSPSSSWSSFNLEQQGAIVDQWFGGTRASGQTAMDAKDPYFRYVRDNVRAGRD